MTPNLGKWHRATQWLLCAALFFAALFTAVAFAPASWLDAVLARVTDDRLRLTNSSGTIWRGAGHLVLADVSAETRAEARAGLSGQLTQGVTLPPRLTWAIAAWPLLVARLEGSIKIEGVPETIAINGNLQQLRGSGGVLELPTVALDRLGSPWNTVQPRGKLQLKWEPFLIERGRISGNLELDLAEVSSALSPVKPLGHYRIRFQGLGDRAQINMSTVSGALKLTGDGQWSSRGGLRFSAYAQASDEEKQRLQPLLGLIGRREGERTVIKIGA